MPPESKGPTSAQMIPVSRWPSEEPEPTSLQQLAREQVRRTGAKEYSQTGLSATRRVTASVTAVASVVGPGLVTHVTYESRGPVAARCHGYHQRYDNCGY